MYILNILYIYLFIFYIKTTFLHEPADYHHMYSLYIIYYIYLKKDFIVILFYVFYYICTSIIKFIINHKLAVSCNNHDHILMQ